MNIFLPPSDGHWMETNSGDHGNRLEEGMGDITGERGLIICPCRDACIWALVKARFALERALEVSRTPKVGASPWFIGLYLIIQFS